MSQAPEMVTMKYSLEELRCSLCTAYLSCAPIQLLPDGNSICGRCSVTGEEQTYRMLKLEAKLSNTLFPCQYKNNGCEERLVFGHTEEHEVKCDFRNIACPSIADKTCAWESSALEIMDHFTEAHPNCVLENAEFKIQIDQDATDLLIVRVNNVTFALKFEYTADNSNLYYDIKYLTQNVQEASYKIKLINDGDQDHCIILKGDDCLPFNVHNMQKTGLVVNNFLQNLNNPNMIKVAVDFSLIISDKSLIVDNDFLQTVRCTECEGYLLPPLFETKTGVICSNCNKILTDATPSTDNKLKERAAKANFPCYWIGCNFIARAADFQQHAESCSFRLYECINKETCQETFKREQAITHFEGHGYEYFPEKFVYKCTLNIESAAKSIATFKNNGIISIKFGTRFGTEGGGQYTHELNLGAVGTDINKLVLKMQFSHEHCKLHSKLYSLALTSPVWYFWKKHFPACFKENEELTATLEVADKK